MCLSIDAGLRGNGVRLLLLQPVGVSCFQTLVKSKRLRTARTLLWFLQAMAEDKQHQPTTLRSSWSRVASAARTGRGGGRC